MDRGAAGVGHGVVSMDLCAESLRDYKASIQLKGRNERRMVVYENQSMGAGHILKVPYCAKFNLPIFLNNIDCLAIL